MYFSCQHIKGDDFMFSQGIELYHARASMLENEFLSIKPM